MSNVAIKFNNHALLVYCQKQLPLNNPQGFIYGGAKQKTQNKPTVLITAYNKKIPDKQPLSKRSSIRDI